MEIPTSPASLPEGQDPVIKVLFAENVEDAKSHKSDSLATCDDDASVDRPFKSVRDRVEHFQRSQSGQGRRSFKKTVSSTCFHNTESDEEFKSATGSQGDNEGNGATEHLNMDMEGAASDTMSPSFFNEQSLHPATNPAPEQKIVEELEAQAHCFNDDKHIQNGLKPIKTALSDSVMKLNKENDHQASVQNPMHTMPPTTEVEQASSVSKQKFDALAEVVENLVEEVERLKKQLAATQVTHETVERLVYQSNLVIQTTLVQTPEIKDQ